MVKPLLLVIVLAGLMMSACSGSGTPAASAATAAQVAGTYECFGVGDAGMNTMGTLILNADGSGTLGDSSLTWHYDETNGAITFDGEAGLQDATYLADGPSLSVNLRADVIVTGAPEGHFTCVKSSEEPAQ